MENHDEIFPSTEIDSTIKQEIENRILNSENEFKNATILERVFDDNIVKSGNNFCSKATRFTIKYEKNGKKYEKSYFLKLPYTIPHYEFVRQTNIYTKEVYIYENVLPLNKLHLPNDSLAPEFHGTDGNEALILEDLSKSGYRTLNRNLQLDFEHCAVALKLLAKFHAFTVNIQGTQPKVLDPVRNVDPMMGSLILKNEKYCADFRQRFSKVFQRAIPTFAKENSALYEFLKENSIRIIMDEFSVKGSPFVVFNHGDFWTNNIMFKYDCYSQVTTAKCIDFQLCRWTSPVIDIIYFTVTSMRFEIFQKYFDILLEIYVNTLNSTMNYLNCGQECVTFDNLRKELYTKCGWWLMVLISAAPLILSNPENDYASAGGGLFTDKYLDEDQYIEFSKLWMSYYINSGIFSRHQDTADAIHLFKSKFKADNKTTIQKYSLDYQYAVVMNRDDYTTHIIRLNFEYLSNEETVCSSVILKIPSYSLDYGYEKEYGIFEREVFWYEKVLPELLAFANSKNVLAPTLYGATETKAIILEDLTANGHRLYEEKFQLNLDHSLIALESLARYHALTVKYLQNQSNAKLSNKSIGPFQLTPFLEKQLRNMYEKFLKLVDPFLSKSILQKLQQHKDKILKLPALQKCADTDDINVIIHGDFQSKNIFFQYDDDRQAIEARIIDWKWSMKASPVVDLIYFFVTSVHFGVFEVYQDTLLKTYLQSFNDVVSTLKCNSHYTRPKLNRNMELHKDDYLNFLSINLQKIMLGNDDVASEIELQKYLTIVVKWINYMESKKLI